LRDDRLYGLSVSDMKGGLAASLFAFRNLAAEPSAWGGEAVIAFAGDEETMGRAAPSTFWTPSRRHAGMR
jgi:succinyl-diaminopimelate desuccinylase